MNLKEIIFKISTVICIMAIVLLMLQSPGSAEFYVCIFVIMLNIVFLIILFILIKKDVKK